ncbi:RteC domain-containing protein [uncultured Flavobacterium sp.]|uniref:RteC domain-containing protein n=1 Tax=uncultured Flavobacterium sp. TaxID=165435 RepID=UPI0030EE7A67|tara:strand:+ start:43353 stop:44201 length:849 start_codon:yes stop_codon:yes gene_type:complete
MKTYSTTLITALEKQLKKIHGSNVDIILQAKQAMTATINKLEELKIEFIRHTFEDKTKEIEFFKQLKPQLTSKLIYYNEIYNMEVSKPTSTNKDIQKHYNKELAKLKNFFNDNKEFYKYYRSGNTCLDKKYFIRRKHDISLTVDSTYFQSDYIFATSHDYKVAKIIANEALHRYIETTLQKHGKNIIKNNENNETLQTLKWTGSKVALVELIYALHTAGIFNNGNSSLNETTKNLEKIFNIDLGQFNRIFTEIKKRKTIEQTSFLNSLKENLTKKITDSDEK